ncbi:thiol reductase thioredoxin [Pseudorhodoferax aquiterrae]|uniref:Thiol reductase thioredoxin n=1 Tax=Pseudorhodoferax aquiterrae TaxID=747304 RepID=A0ABQ3FWL4_9BURK|nr:thioredoxin family protein [Pseudorhodoferax aquiterrae]GHC71644.1 thiol reductase thioredoxin [Pseudorhodoferax aquiterrae]
MSAPYTSDEPGRAEVDAMCGPVLLEFGDNFCGFCRAAQPAIARALEERPDVRHIKVADGRGRPLGRSFGVKLWPTLVFLQDGREVERLVRPVDHHPVAKALRALGDGAA